MNKIFSFLKSLFTPKQPERPRNTGLVDAPLRSTDYVIGATSPLVYKERLSDGDWLPYVWSEVKQWCFKNGVYQDNLGCTGNALATSIETQIFFLTGQKIKISRRYINKMSGCNQGSLRGKGNYIIAPVDFVRKNGFVLESSYPTPELWTVDEYYADIPAEKAEQLRLEALQNKVKFGLTKTQEEDCLKYEYLQISDPNIDLHLKHAPILASIPGHQTCAVFSPTQLTTYRDSYEPWNKQYSSANFLTLLKVIVETVRLEAFIFKFNDSPECWLGAKFDSMETLNEMKQSFPVNYPKYYMRPDIVTLPIKKPF